MISQSVGCRAVHVWRNKVLALCKHTQYQTAWKDQKALYEGLMAPGRTCRMILFLTSLDLLAKNSAFPYLHIAAHRPNAFVTLVGRSSESVTMPSGSQGGKWEWVLLAEGSAGGGWVLCCSAQLWGTRGKASWAAEHGEQRLCSWMELASVSAARGEMGLGLMRCESRREKRSMRLGMQS